MKRMGKFVALGPVLLACAATVFVACDEDTPSTPTPTPRADAGARDAATGGDSATGATDAATGRDGGADATAPADGGRDGGGTTGGDAGDASTTNPDASPDAATDSGSDAGSDAAAPILVVDDAFVGGPSACFGNVNGSTQDQTECAPRPAGAVGKCWRIHYTPSEGTFGGCLWQSDGTGFDAPPLPVPQGATKVTFWAAGAVGGESITFAVGLDEELSFTTRSVIALTTTMTKYTIDLTGKTYPQAGFAGVDAPFGWIINSNNPVIGTGGTFYLDSIQWE